MRVEILRGADQFVPEKLARVPDAVAAAPRERESDAIPEPASSYADLYSNKHEKLLLRTDHIDRIDAIRRHYDAQRVHPSRRRLTTSDIVNGALDFVFEHPIPFHRLSDADALRELIAEHVYHDVISRWRQWNEVF